MKKNKFLPDRCPLLFQVGINITRVITKLHTAFIDCMIPI